MACVVSRSILKDRPKDVKAGKLFIRTDASTDIGVGHLMRCLALAQAWQQRCGKVSFIGYWQGKGLRTRLQSEGVETSALENVYPHPDDLRKTLEIVRSKEVDAAAAWLVLDGYHFDQNYQEAICEAGYQVMVLDDYQHLPYYRCDVLLNPNLDAPSKRYVCQPKTMLLLGPRYALLRSEFIRKERGTRGVAEQARRILVTFGGSDPKNVTGKVIEGLNSIANSELEVKVAVGPANPNLNEIEKAISASPFRAQIIHNVNDMSRTIGWADLAVASASSTCWELAYMGVPAIVIVFAENQKEVGATLDRKGVCKNLGSDEEVTANQIGDAVKGILDDRDVRHEMSVRGQKVVDGKGSFRVVQSMLSAKVTLRAICELDCELSWQWVNEPEVRKSAFHSDSISFEGHRAWFSRKLIDPHCLHYVAMDREGVPVGQIRFDIRDGCAETDVSVTTGRRGCGFGTAVVSAGLKKLMEMGGIRTVHAYVRLWNIASLRVFEKGGFVKAGEVVMKGSRCFHMMREIE